MSRELKAFLIDTLYRCIWTFTQAFLGCVAVGGITDGLAIEDIPWKTALSVASAATFFCLLKQIGKYAKEHIQAQGQEEDEIEYIGAVYDEDYEEADTNYEDIEEGEAE